MDSAVNGVTLLGANDELGEGCAQDPVLSLRCGEEGILPFEGLLQLA